MNNHELYLDVLVLRAEQDGVSHKITPTLGFMFAMDFAPESFGKRNTPE